MKKRFFSILILAFSLAFTASADGLSSFTLPNGLSVFVWEDSTKPDVYGEVIVKAGSVNDPEQYTGLAHYLEHMMFKGTQKIGALDWAQEQPIYEQIIAKYDEMANTSDEAARKEINRQINELALQEGNISITQEYANLIDFIGGTGLNAGTSYERTVYYNSFPANQLQKWMYVASERFINPVFRSFQSELETVYEEYNLYADMNSYKSQRFFYEKIFEGTPYARDVIGLPEHLKSPRLSELIKFYNTWYVPGNMALIITGNVSARDVLRFANSTFGRLPAAPVQERATSWSFPAKGRKQYTIKAGDNPTVYMAFDGVNSSHPDEVALNICLQLLSNSAGSGLLDKLSLDGDVLAAGAAPMGMCNIGRTVIYAVPYFDKSQQIFDSNKNVEKLLNTEIAKVVNGEFSEEEINSIKIGMKRDFDLALEGNEGKAEIVSESFMSGQDIHKMLAFKDEVDAVTIDDIKAVAKKYLTDNCIVIYDDGNMNAKPGKSQKIAKPDIKPITQPEAINSMFGAQFKAMASLPPKGFYADFNDVTTKQINSYSKLYYTRNDFNDIYTLVIRYGANSKLFPLLKTASGLMSTAGILAQFDSRELKAEFAKLGAVYNILTDDDYLYIVMRGYEATLKEACQLLTKTVLLPKLDDKQLQSVISSYAIQRMIRSGKIDYQSPALSEYIRYGEDSRYRTELTDSQIYNLDISSLTSTFVNATHYAAEIHYSGVMPFDEAYQILSTCLPLVAGEQPSTSPLVRPMKEDYTENTVYFLPNSESQQAQIWFYIPGTPYDKEQRVARTAFNKYFGMGFGSLVVNEIREKNSMAYTSYGRIVCENLPGAPEYFMGYIGTQNDKALEAIKIYMGLLDDMPEHPENLGSIKSYIKQVLMTSAPDKRGLSEYVASLEKEGYDHDPSIERTEIAENLQFSDIVNYYNSHVKGRPVAIGIVGNPKDIKVKDLEQFGKVIRLTDDHIYNENDKLFQ